MSIDGSGREIPASGSVTYLGDIESHVLRRMADDIDAGEVTHVVCAYRLNNGDIAYRLVGDADLTYLIGMLDRVKQAMHAEAQR